MIALIALTTVEDAIETAYTVVEKTGYEHYQDSTG
jgi:hypothetical protein